MKILYAAANRKSSHELLKRFLETYGEIHQVKAAAYPSSVGNLFIDWNLEALFEINRKEIIDFENDTFEVFQNEVRAFRPDLIVSDLEPFSSHVGIQLGIPVYQVSPFLLHFGARGEVLKLYARYSALFVPHAKNKYIYDYIINNSDRRLILSHMGDVPSAPRLKDGFEYVRPSYQQIVSPEDIIIGNPVVLSDYYYNHLAHVVKPDYRDLASIVSSSYNIKYQLSGKNRKKNFNLSINDDIPFLSQLIKSP